MKPQRRRDLIRILHQGKARSQAEIVEALRAAGHHVTQATVSRDLREIGAIKLRAGDGFIYKLDEDVPRSASADLMARDLLRTLYEFGLDIRAAASIVVVQTAPGHAAAVARAIDRSGADEVAGTIAGDDTIFVATTSDAVARRIAGKWSTAAAEEAS